MSIYLYPLTTVFKSPQCTCDIENAATQIGVAACRIEPITFPLLTLIVAVDSVLTVSQLNATSRQRQRRTRKRNRTKESPQFTVNTQHSEATFTQHSPAVNRLEDSTRESRPTVLEDSTKESRPTVASHSPTEDGLEDSTDGVANILRRKLKRLELGESPKKPGVISGRDRDKLLEPTPHSEAGHSSGVVTEQSEEDISQVSQGSGRPDPLGNTASGKDD